jgi:putative nucleotidyltransferase with HDIG domain
MAALQSNGASVGGVGDIIAQDMGMTAKVLQLVNSSFFGMSGHVSSAKEAVVLLGIDVVKTLVLSIEVFSRARTALSVISVDEIHDHCIRTGVIAKDIACLEKMSGEYRDNAMIASMLHDLGKLLLAEHFSESYKEVMEMVRQSHMPVFKAERAVFGVTHAEVGAYLLGLWGLPESIINAIAFHHAPGEYVSGKFALCGLVHVAELMEHHERYQPGNWGTLNGIDNDYMDALGLWDKIPFWRGCFKDAGSGKTGRKF